MLEDHRKTIFKRFLKFGFVPQHVLLLVVVVLIIVIILPKIIKDHANHEKIYRIKKTKSLTIIHIHK